MMLAFGAVAKIAGRPELPSTGSPGSAVESPAVTSAGTQVLVRLVVVHPGARMVHAAGDFNGWNPAQTPLEELPNGAWAVTIPLQPGRYEYMFVVNGDQWIADPFAAEESDDGFGSRNAVLDVRPPGGIGEPL
jgi:1,4-alpha-glucan branching enzyme